MFKNTKLGDLATPRRKSEAKRYTETAHTVFPNKYDPGWLQRRVQLWSNVRTRFSDRKTNFTTVNCYIYIQRAKICGEKLSTDSSLWLSFWPKLGPLFILTKYGNFITLKLPSSALFFLRCNSQISTDIFFLFHANFGVYVTAS